MSGTGQGEGEAISRLLRWAHAPKLGLMLFALVESGAWMRLATGPATAGEVATGCGLDPGRLAEALDLLAHFDLLRRDDESYALPHGAAGIEPLIRLEAELLRDWVGGDEVAGWLGGAPTTDPLDGDPDPSRVELYLRGFEAVAERVALGLWRAAGLRHQRRLLDLGGAAGAHADVFLRLADDLAVTVVDRPVMQTFWSQRMAHHGERARFVASDLRRPSTLAPLLAEHDAVLLSNVLHLLDPPRRTALCSEVLRSAPPGTLFVVHDLFLGTPDDEIAGLMTVDWMLLGARFNMTTAECAEWLAALGFELECDRGLPGLPGGVVVARVGAAVPPAGGEPAGDGDPGRDQQS